MDGKVERRWIGGTIMCLWLVSLIVPAAGWGSGPGAMGPGWQLLSIGWIGFLNMQFGWFANVPFLLSMPLAVGRRQASTLLFLAACILILLPTVQTLWWSEVETDSGRYPVVVGLGYYLWFVALLAQSAWLLCRALSWKDDSGWMSNPS